MDKSEAYRRHLQLQRQALKRLGLNTVECRCGQTNPLCFIKEHFERRKNSDKVVPLCLNCHAIKSAWEAIEDPVPGLFPGDPFERLGHALRGCSRYLLMIVETLQEAAEIMFKLAGKGIKLEG